MIRPFKLSETEDMLRVWFEASKISHSFLSIEDLEREKEEIRTKYIPISESYVYETDGKFAGFVSLIGCHIGALFVDPDRHGQGIGTALLRYVIENKKANSVDVFEGNTRAISLYRSHGFKDKGMELDPQYGYKVLKLELDNQ